MKKIVFFFEKNVGFTCLKYLNNFCEGTDILAITTAKNLESFPKLKEYCDRNRITFCTVENPNDATFLSEIKNLGVKQAFAISYSKIFRNEIIDLFSDGIINLHPALLPKNGGCFPTMWSIIEGDRETGYTLHRIDKGVDTGPIIAQTVVEISEHDTGESLYAKQTYAGEKLFYEWALKIVNGEYKTQIQKGVASYHDKRLPFGGYIPWDKDFVFIKRLIRAFKNSSYAGLLVRIDGQEVEVQNIEIAPDIQIATVGEHRIVNGQLYFRCQDEVVKMFYTNL